VRKSSQNTPLVSVVMITYKHEAFIAEAIEGVLMQECDFEVELIIADDNSPDKTSLIVSKYIETHPKGQWIKYTRHERNKGMMPNFIWALEQAKGKYIALCEGDDYWIDSSKLEKQVSFLEANSNASLSYHPVKIINCRNHNEEIFTEPIKNATIEDAIKIQYFIHTSSIMYRAALLNISEYKIFRNVLFADLALILSLLDKGVAGLILSEMSCYRLHDSGVTSTLNLSYPIYSIKVRKIFNKMTKFRYSNIIYKSTIDLLKIYSYNLQSSYKSLVIVKIILITNAFRFAFPLNIYQFKHFSYTFLIPKIYRFLKK
jgi:glycosyltransferase involved in cell wall biosynthesis